MEAFLKGAYQEIVRFTCRLWAYRLKILVYVIVFILVAHALNPYEEIVRSVSFVPEKYRFIIPLLLAIFLAIAASELIIKLGSFVHKRLYLWNHLTPEELEFIACYFEKNIRTKYVIAYNGACKDSGTINLLLNKSIIYLASGMSEYRAEGGSCMSADQYFPFNIYEDAFTFFKRKFPEKIPSKQPAANNGRCGPPHPLQMPQH